MTNQPSNLEAQLEALRQQQAMPPIPWNAEELRVVYLVRRVCQRCSGVYNSMPASGPELGRNIATVKEALQTDLEHNPTNSENSSSALKL